jgi:hypothetical protein
LYNALARIHVAVRNFRLKYEYICLYVRMHVAQLRKSEGGNDGILFGMLPFASQRALDDMRNILSYQALMLEEQRRTQLSPTAEESEATDACV